MRIVRPVICLAVLLAVLALPARAQSTMPEISQRNYVSGNIKVKVTGSFEVDEDVAINTKASYSDGEKTWLQFGVDGSVDANALITYGDGEIGISASRAKAIVTGSFWPGGEKTECSGTTQVTVKEITGHYTCVGLTSYNQTTRKMGTVNVEVRFTAKS